MNRRGAGVSDRVSLRNVSYDDNQLLSELVIYCFCRVYGVNTGLAYQATHRLSSSTPLESRPATAPREIAKFMETG